MANEIRVDNRLTVNNGSLSITRTPVKQINMSGSSYSSIVQSIATTAAGTAVTIGSAVATYGVALFVNLDITNYVQIGVQVTGTFYPLLKLKPGESALCRLAPSTTVYAVADTSAVKLETIVVED